MKNFISGSSTAMITPFYDDGGVNFDSFGEMIEYQIENGTDALVVLGTTGEPATMTEDEKVAVMKFAKERVAGRVKLIFGTGSNSTAKAVAATKRAEELGADGVLAVTPYYNPTLYADLTYDIPPCFIACGGCDPALDNSVTLYEMLYDKGFTCELKVYEGIMHAFLHYSRMLDMAYDAMQDGADFMARARIIKRGK